MVCGGKLDVGMMKMQGKRGYFRYGARVCLVQL